MSYRDRQRKRDAAVQARTLTERELRRGYAHGGAYKSVYRHELLRRGLQPERSGS